MVFFLIGPSHAGKTTLSKRIAAQFPQMALVNVDDEVNKAEERLKEQGVTDLRGWQGRWDRTVTIFQSTANRQNLVTFDVGAGSLQTDAAFQYFSDRLSSVVLITAPFHVILGRHSGRSTNDLWEKEFDERHWSFYERIPKIIDTSALSEQECTNRLIDYLGIS